MKKQCEGPGCTVLFEPKRSDARFHSDACRKAAARLAGADPETGEVLKKKPYDKAAALKAFQKMGLDSVRWLETGIPGFDELTKIPRGRITQIQGRYGVGKTTLCLNMIAGLKGVRVLYIDAEAALNPELLTQLEVDPDTFTLYNKSNYIEDVSEVIRAGARSGDYDLIVLDSVPMTDTKTSHVNDITAKNIGQKAFIVNKLVQIIAMDLKRTDTAMVFINQVRDVIGGYVPQTYTPGGSGIGFQASLIINLKTIPSWRFPKDPKDHIYKGHEVEATILKSKVNTPHRTKKFKLLYPQPLVIDEF